MAVRAAVPSAASPRRYALVARAILSAPVVAMSLYDWLLPLLDSLCAVPDMFPGIAPGKVWPLLAQFAALMGITAAGVVALGWLAWGEWVE